jgi:hypothetical protein
MADKGQEKQEAQGTLFLLLLGGNYLWRSLAGSSWELGNSWHKQLAWTCRYRIAVVTVSFAQILKLIPTLMQRLASVPERY